MTKLRKDAIAMKDYFGNIRRNIHQNPELGHMEINTSKIIKAELEKYGLEITNNSSETGVVGILYGKKPGINQVTAIRADIDALPIMEKSDKDYCSQVDGVMHACGHDGHTAIALATASLLSLHAEDFGGIVKFIFQPAEEKGNGAKKMVEAGCLENPKVDSIVALHSWPYLPTGVIGTWVGPYYASSDSFKIIVKGDSGHGAYPHRTRDALLASAILVTGLQSITSRQINALQTTVLSVCTFHAGTAHNVIPPIVEIEGTVRSHSSEARREVKGKMEKIISGILSAYDCEYEFDYNYGTEVVINNGKTVAEMTAAVKKINGEDFVEELPEAVMGSEDFSEYSMRIPDSAIFRIGVTPKGEEKVPLHSDKFDFNDDTIPYGSAALAQYVITKNN